MSVWTWIHNLTLTTDSRINKFLCFLQSFFLLNRFIVKIETQQPTEADCYMSDCRFRLIATFRVDVVAMKQPGRQKGVISFVIATSSSSTDIFDEGSEFYLALFQKPGFVSQLLYHLGRSLHWR